MWSPRHATLSLASTNDGPGNFGSRVRFAAHRTLTFFALDGRSADLPVAAWSWRSASISINHSDGVTGTVSGGTGATTNNITSFDYLILLEGDTR